MKVENSLRLHRLATKTCTRCGKRKTIKASRSMWKRVAEFTTCPGCRAKARERYYKERKGKKMISTLKKAEPTQRDVMAARMVGMGHLYWADVLNHPNGNLRARPVDETNEARAYRDLLEIVMCRERELELCLAQLSAEQRERVGL